MTSILICTCVQRPTTHLASALAAATTSRPTTLSLSTMRPSRASLVQARIPTRTYHRHASLCPLSLTLCALQEPDVWPQDARHSRQAVGRRHRRGHLPGLHGRQRRLGPHAYGVQEIIASLIMSGPDKEIANDSCSSRFLTTRGRGA